MSAEKGIPLTFATFFTCGIKTFTNLTQRDCINLLLTGNLVSDSIDVLSDSVCSRYAKGEKNLTNSLRVALTLLNVDDAKDRLSKSNIQDFTIVANALAVLLKNSSLSDIEKNKLLKYHEPKDELTFIAQVFLACLRGDNSYPLDKSLIHMLEDFRYSTDSKDKTDSDAAAYKSNTRGTVSGSNNPNPDAANYTGEDEDFDWMRNYVPGYVTNTPPVFVRSKLKIETVILELPQDYAAIIYALKPTLVESAYARFTMDDFIETMNIDMSHNTCRLLAGSLEYWHFEGDIESILASLKYHDFSEISDFAFQLYGEFTEEDVAGLKEHLINSSNAKVNLLASIIFDKEPATVHLMLFAHRCREKVNAQKSNNKYDGIHEYVLQRDRGTDR